MDTRRTKGKRETKDHLEKDSGEGEKQGKVEGHRGQSVVQRTRQPYAPTGAHRLDNPDRGDYGSERRCCPSFSAYSIIQIVNINSMA